MIKTALAAIAVLCSIAEADVCFEQVLQTSNYMSTGKSQARSRVMIKGDWSRTETEMKISGVASGTFKRRSISIVRLDRQLVWNIWPDRKAYSEVSFSELKKLVGNPAQTGRDPAAETPRIEGQRTGARRKIAGLECEQVVVTMHCKINDPESGRPVDGIFVNDMWIADLAAIADEIERFNRRLLTMAGVRELNQEMMSAFGIGPAAYAAFEKKVKEQRGLSILVKISLALDDGQSGMPRLVLFSAVNEVKKVSDRKLKPEDFNLPAGYEQLAAGGLF